jgi:hypothetical protein
MMAAWLRVMDIPLNVERSGADYAGTHADRCQPQGKNAGQSHPDKSPR